MKRITKIKWLKVSLIISIVMICLYAIAQDDPSGYTSWFRLRMWDEGDHPGADSVNQNLIDIDLHLHNRDKRIDSLKSAYMEMFNFPSGTWKRYDSTVFDGDSLKFKTGVVPLISANNVFSGNNTITSGELKFDASGPGGTNLNFVYDNDLGGVFIKKNTSTTLLEFNEADGLYWQFKYPVTVNGNVDITGNYMVNGVPISSGGGDAYLTNRQTFTKRNVFSDTLKADGLSLIDNARITSNLNVTGDVISDLNFLKGSSTSIGTISTDSLAFITNNTKRIVINKNGYTNFTDTVQMSDYVQINGNLNVGTNIVAVGNIIADSIAGIGKFITSINAGNLSSGTILQSRLSDSVFKLSNLDTTRFLDQSDTSKYFRLGDIITPITEIVNSLVVFSATVTFAVSPVFNGLVNFANGINVTGNGVFSGNITADTIFANKLSGNYKIMSLVPVPSSNPIDTSDIWWGGKVYALSTSYTYHQLEMPINCKIIKVCISNVPTSVAATSENVVHKIKRYGSTASDTASYTITSVGQMTAGAKFYSATVSINITAGDKIVMKMETPNWATNPVSLFMSGFLVYE